MDELGLKSLLPLHGNVDLINWEVFRFGHEAILIIARGRSGELSV
jgi:hypothetical protein